MPPLSTRSKSFLVLLILLAASEFIVRGPARFLEAADFNDFISPYIQSRALIKGMDPYSPQVLVQLWPVDGAHRPEFLAKDLADGTLIAKRGIPTAYPLTCLFLLAPLAVLPWPVAHIVWLGLTVGLTFGLIWSLLSLLTDGGGPDWHSNDWRSYVFVAFSLALAPVQTGLATGSIVSAAAAFCGIAMALDRRGSLVFAGVLFGVAICLKPQIGLPFLACYLFRRRWHLSGIALGTTFAIAIMAMTRLAVSSTPWMQNYLLDNKVLLATGMLGDFTERNPTRFGLINLQVLVYAILHRVSAANVTALVASGVLFGIWARLVLRSRSLDLLLSLGAIAVLSLFPVYHRLYDAYVLIFPLCWSLREFSGFEKRIARGALLLLAPFLVPGGTALEQLQLSGRISQAIRHSWCWTTIVMPHEIWALLLLSLLLLRAMDLNRKRWESLAPSRVSVPRV